MQGRCKSELGGFECAVQLRTADGEQLAAERRCGRGGTDRRRRLHGGVEDAGGWCARDVQEEKAGAYLELSARRCVRVARERNSTACESIFVRLARTAQPSGPAAMSSVLDEGRLPASAPPPRRWSLAELAHATDDFSPSRKLGEGGYGEVFRGELGDGSAIAVKRMAAESVEGESGFLAEVSISGAVRHPNVLPVLGVVRARPGKELARGRGWETRRRAAPRRGSASPPRRPPHASHTTRRCSHTRTLRQRMRVRACQCRSVPH